MKQLSIQKKIVLWFSAMLLIIVLFISAMTFAIASSVLNENIRERLYDEVKCAELDSLYYHSFLTHSTAHYDLCAGIHSLDFLECLDTVHYRHFDVHQHGIGVTLQCIIDGLLAIFRP